MVRNFAFVTLAVMLSLAFSSAYAGGCQSATLTAVISPSDTAYACDGAPIQLSASALGGTPLAWEWSTAETDQDITVTTPGNYFLVVFDQLGCTDTTYVEVVHLDKPTVELGPDQTICAGDTAFLDGQAASSWAWSTGETTQIIGVTEAMTVALVMTNEFACSDSDTVTIFQYPVPVVDIGNDTSVCEGENILLDAGNGFNAYLWTTNESTSFIMASTTGNYSVVVTDTNNCETSSNTVALTVNVPVAPTITEDNNILTSTTANSYQWYMDGTAINGAVLAAYTPDADGNYYVEIVDDNGCTATSNAIDFVLIQEIRPEMISAGFSPNGDGVLDTWMIPYIDFYPNNELVIFNRWGNTVYKKTPYTSADPWTGQSDKGKDLTDGVYYFILELGDGFETIQGQVVINR